jgi:hypothetical protein
LGLSGSHTAANGVETKPGVRGEQGRDENSRTSMSWPDESLGSQ